MTKNVQLALTKTKPKFTPSKIGIWHLKFEIYLNMRSVREIFKSKEYLLDEPEVEKLVEYCEELQDEIVEFKYQKTNNKELAMLDMLKEVIKGCTAIEKEQMEHERFGFEAPNYEATISNLKNYIYSRCRDEKIWL